MITVEELKGAIKSLPTNDYSNLREWFAKRDWEIWDRKIKRDSDRGKLDFLLDEVHREK